MTADDSLFSDSDKLRNAILHELEKDISPEDPAGRTRLQRIAARVAKLENDSNELSVFTSAGVELLHQTQHLSAKKTQELVTFLIACKQAPNRLKEAVSTAQRQYSKETPEEVFKRADLFRLAYKIGNQVRPAEIEKDAAVKKLRPWVWFDIAVASNPKDVRRYIRAIGDLPEFTKAMIPRLPFLYRVLSADRFADLIQEARLYLPQSDTLFENTLKLLTGTDQTLEEQREFAHQVATFAERVPIFNTLPATA